MKKKILIASILFSLMILTNFANSEKTSEILVDRIVEHFKQLSISGATNVKTITLLLNDCMKQARKFKMENKIDQSFLDRYQRLLAVIKLLLMDDAQRILTPIISSEIGKFPGARDSFKSISKPGSATIATVAAFLSEELVALRLYLMKKKPVKLDMFAKEKRIPFAQLKERNTLYYHKGEKYPFTGIAVKKNTDGRIREKISFKKGKMSGQRIQYSYDGTKQAEGMMKNNVKSGIWIFYDDIGEIKEVVNCNYKLRYNFSQYQTELKRGNPEKAASFLQKAIQIKPLKKILAIQRELALHQSMGCINAQKYTQALKYARLWTGQVVKSGKSGQEQAEAFYRLGVIYWQQIYKKGKQLTLSQRSKLIEEGLQALDRAIRLDKYAHFPYAYKSFLYREKALLDPGNRQQYLTMAAEARKKMSQVMQESRKHPPTEYGNKNSRIFTSTIKKSGKKSPYRLKEDELQDTFLFFAPPPPPPPPPPAKKR